MLRLSRTWAFQKCSHRRSTSPTSHQRHRRRITSTEDQISQLPDLISGLPDEILVKILSLLSVKEAVTMSILSHRWRHLWTFFTGDLDFDARVLYRREYGFEYRSLEYIDLVNHVLGVHQGHKIDNLKIWFGIDSRYSNHVDSWIKFAIEKRVNGLELDFTDRIRYQDTEYYSFPELGKLVSMSSSNASFSCLSSLALINIHVTDSVVSHFLANCPCLEVLRVVHSNHLEYLNISGPSLKLKYLEIFRCDALKSLEISATNLKFLAYSGPKENIHLTSVPLLSELSLGDDYCESFAYEAHHPRHSIYLSQLVKLTLLLPYDVCRFAPRFPKQFPLLGNLEELELQIMLENGNSMFAFLSLIKASPSLSKFKMLISEGCPLTERWMLMVAQSWELHRKVARHRHEGLKVVELSGFLGYRADFELAEELLHIAVSLEKLVIDTRRAWSRRLFYEAIERGYDEENTVIEARKMRAREIGAKVPPGVEFVIL